MAAAEAESLLTGVHALAIRITGWLATIQARLGMATRASLNALAPDRERTVDSYNARAVIAIAEGDPTMALELLRDVLDGTTPNVPSFKLVEAYLLAGTARPGPAGSKRRRCRSRGRAGSRRVESADLPVCGNRDQKAARHAPASRNRSWRSARRHRRRAERLGSGRHRLEPIAPSRRPQPERAPRIEISPDESDEGGDRPRALRLGQHREHPRPQHLFQAWRPGSFGGR